MKYMSEVVFSGWISHYVSRKSVIVSKDIIWGRVKQIHGRAHRHNDTTNLSFLIK
jgi:hypothetical protein